MDELTPQAVAIAIGCIIATYTDVRWGKIYNWTTFPLIALGLVMNASLGQWQLGIIGLIAAFAIHYPLFHYEIQKGGDVKLLMAIGALLGGWFVVEASIWYAIFYIPAGLGTLIVRRRVGNLFAVARYQAAERAGQPLPGEKPPVTLLRTAPVIAAAALAAFATPWLHFLLFGGSAVGPVSTGG